MDKGSMSLARQLATELVSALCSFEEDESGCCLFHESSIDACPCPQELFCPFCCWEPLLLARCAIKYSLGCLLFRWLYKFDVLESFAATVTWHRRHLGESTQHGRPLLSVSNPKYFHTKAALVFFFDTSPSPSTVSYSSIVSRISQDYHFQHQTPSCLRT